MILRDCPRCKRANVQGRIYQDKDDKIAKGVIRGGLTIATALINPLLGVATYMASSKGADAIAKHRDSDGKVKYRFNCPNPSCNYEWFVWIME